MLTPTDKLCIYLTYHISQTRLLIKCLSYLLMSTLEFLDIIYIILYIYLSVYICWKICEQAQKMPFDLHCIWIGPAKMSLYTLDIQNLLLLLLLQIQGCFFLGSHYGGDFLLCSNRHKIKWAHKHTHTHEHRVALAFGADSCKNGGQRAIVVAPVS